jgi:hypothetical protein
MGHDDTIKHEITSVSMDLKHDIVEVRLYRTSLKTHKSDIQIGITLKYPLNEFKQMVSPFLERSGFLNTGIKFFKSVGTGVGTGVDPRDLLHFKEFNEKLTLEQSLLKDILMVCYFNYTDKYWQYIVNFWDGKLQDTEIINLDDFNEQLTELKEKLSELKEEKLKQQRAQGGKSRRRRSHKKSTKKSKTRKNRRRL